LNYVRQIREITGEKEDREYDGLNGQIAQRLDEQICKKIFDIIQSKEEVADITDLRKFFAWLDIANRNSTKEIFTTNYDLLLEKAMEDNRIPYFDGFVGSYEPFFWPESIEKTVGNHDLTFNWIRLWKIHGSLNWEFRKDSLSDNFKIVRNGKVDVPENELVVYPSKEKYNLSRKQPFIAYFDRLKNYLLQGERVFIFSGYSFSDQHINEIIFNGLRQNPRLYAVCMCFSDEQVDFMESIAISYLNLCVMGPKKRSVVWIKNAFVSKSMALRRSEHISSSHHKLSEFPTATIHLPARSQTAVLYVACILWLCHRTESHCSCS